MRNHILFAGLVIATVIAGSAIAQTTYHGKGVPYDSTTGFGAMGNNATANNANSPSNEGGPYQFNLTLQQKASGDLSQPYGLGGSVNFDTYEQIGQPEFTNQNFIWDFATLSEVESGSNGPIYDYYGFYANNQYFGTAFLTEQSGFTANPLFDGSGGASHIQGLKSVPTSNSGTSVNDVIGVKSSALAAGTAIFSADYEAGVRTGSHATTNYGLLVDDQSGSGATTNYNIFSSGNGTNYLNSGVQFGKITDPGTAPGAAKLALRVVAGTNAGTCKIIAYAGTSTTPVTIADNVGSGC